ncbi:hypothetical protein BDW72DRAFT_183764 [Aspergillus terricola var. indicus]
MTARQCDEGKPGCANCIDFRVRCSFEYSTSAGDLTSPVSPANEESAAPTKRGRGRPRKAWTIPSQGPRTNEATPNANALCLNQQPPGPRVLSRSASPSPSSLNVADLELLIHFISHTGPGLAHPKLSDNSIARFWSHTVPQIGLSCHTVLHLILALSAHHLAYLAESDAKKSARYSSLADHHGSAGLSGLTKALRTINNSNCGALYVSAILVAKCTFAAGPTDPDDLLVCNISNHAAQNWLSVVQGVRLIRETFDPSVLFSGLMEPLGSSEDESTRTVQPRCIEYGFPRVDWEEPLGLLRDIIASSDDADAAVCLEAYHTVESIYEATYGKSDGSMTCLSRNKSVFLWLYTMDNEFVCCLQQRHPLSLLVLAYYAFLLTTQEHIWFIQRWPSRMLNRIQELIDRDYVEWLRWPMEHAGLPLMERRPGRLTENMD